MTEDELIAVIDAELQRQRDAPGMDAPCLHNRFGDEQGIDGYVNLRQLAEAILSVIDADDAPDADQEDVAGLPIFRHAPVVLTDPMLGLVVGHIMKSQNQIDAILELSPPGYFVLPDIKMDDRCAPSMRIEGVALEQIQRRVRQVLAAGRQPKSP